eukprot:4163754-Prymnesium_polylepis.1
MNHKQAARVGRGGDCYRPSNIRKRRQHSTIVEKNRTPVRVCLVDALAVGSGCDAECVHKR